MKIGVLNGSIQGAEEGSTFLYHTMEMHLMEKVTLGITEILGAKPAQVHLPRLRELLLDKCLHCLAQVLGWLPSPSLAAFAFSLNVQQVAKAGTGLGHLIHKRG